MTKQKTYATDGSVAKAIRILEKLGIRDSVRNIRRVLGGGSHSTINRIKKKLRQYISKKKRSFFISCFSEMKKPFQALSQNISKVLCAVHKYIVPNADAVSWNAEAKMNVSDKIQAQEFQPDEIFKVAISFEKAKKQEILIKYRNERKAKRALEEKITSLEKGKAQIHGLAREIVDCENTLNLKAKQLEQLLEND